VTDLSTDAKRALVPIGNGTWGTQNSGEVVEVHHDLAYVEKLMYWCLVNFSVHGWFSWRGTDVLGKGASETKLLSGISLVCSIFCLKRLIC